MHRETVGPGDDNGEGCRVVAASGHRDGVVEVLPPPGAAQPPPSNAAKCQRDRQRRSHTEAGALGGVAPGQVDDGLRPPQDLAEFAGIAQLGNATNANAMVKVGSPIDSSSAICSDASRDPSRERPA